MPSRGNGTGRRTGCFMTLAEARAGLRVFLRAEAPCRLDQRVSCLSHKASLGHSADEEGRVGLLYGGVFFLVAGISPYAPFLRLLTG